MKRLASVLTVVLVACSTVPQNQPDTQLEEAAATTVTKQLTVSSDDAEQLGTAVLLSSTILDIPYRANSGVQTVGLRFPALALPKNATVTGAFVQFTSGATNSGATSVTIKGQNAGNAPTFTTATNNISGRAVTTQSVTWSPSDWTTTGTAGAAQKTPDLKTIVQSIVNRSDWTSGNSMALIITRTGTATALRRARSADTANGPVLTVTYTTSASTTYSTPANFTASALHNSFGINVHEGYDDTLYKQTSLLNFYIRDLDPEWIRGGIYPSPRAFQPGFLKDLARDGYSISLGLGNPAGQYNNFGTGDAQAAIASLKTGAYAGLPVKQIEMPNEWDCSSPTGSIFSSNPDGWIAELESFYDEYFAAFKAAFPNVAVVGPSFCREATSHMTNRQGEMGNYHAYSGGEEQENDNIKRQIADFQTRATLGRVAATEWGFHNAVNASSTNSFVGVPEDIAAHYLARGHIWMFANGVEQNYVYQLFDQKPNDPGRTEMEEWFGLIAAEGNPNSDPSTWTARPKPAYQAIKRELLLLRDSGTGTAPKTLPFTVTRPANSSMYTIARKDGSYDVVMWLNNSLWNTSTRSVIQDTSASVTFNFNTVSDVDATQPSVNAITTNLGANSTTLNATINGKVTFFHVTPR